MKNLILIFLTLIISFSIPCCTNKHAEKPKEKECNVFVSPFKQLLFSEDHTSEGFIAPLDYGKILLLFRLDPGLEGNHVGTNAYIGFPEKVCGASDTKPQSEVVY